MCCVSGPSLILGGNGNAPEMPAQKNAKVLHSVPKDVMSEKGEEHQKMSCSEKPTKRNTNVKKKGH